MTELILHIGAGKTGSTAIQQALSASRGRLEEAGVAYPTMPGFDVDASGVAHNPIAYALAGHDTGVDLSNVRERLEEVAASYRRVVLSAEVFYMRPRADDCADRADYEHAKEQMIAATAALLKGFDTRVICYLRRQDDWFESIYAERVKTWKAGDYVARSFFEDLDDDPYIGQLERWAAHFGDRLRVRPYEAAQLVDGDVVTDFATTLALPVLATPRGNSAFPVNPRLKRDVLEYQRCLGRLPLGTLERHQLTRALKEVSARLECYEGPDPPDWQRFMEPAQRRTLMQACEARNRYVAQRYFDASVERLFTEEVPSTGVAAYPGLRAADALVLGAELRRVLRRPGFRLERVIMRMRRHVSSPPGFIRVAGRCLLKALSRGRAA